MLLDVLKNKKVNINMDSDGILSYLFLKKYEKCYNIGGFNNSFNLILSENNNLWEDAFIDIFSPKKDVVTIDQHIISPGEQKFDFCKINPHTIIEHHFAFDNSYFSKYPFSTALFILATLEKEGEFKFGFNLFEKLYKVGSDINLCDMILRADGVLYNAVKYKNNVINWGEKLINFSSNGENTKKIIEYIINMTDSKAIKKYETINNFYEEYGLTKDGGYNKERDLKENLKLISNLLKSFSNFMEIETTKNEKTFFIYEGESHVTSDLSNINLDEIDTYAFIRKNAISYTKNITKTENNIKTEIFE